MTANYVDFVWFLVASSIGLFCFGAVIGAIVALHMTKR